MNRMMLTEFETEFSYNQFVVYDSGVDLPGNDWTDEHFNQGFSRSTSSVSFRTLLDFGYAHVQVFDQEYEADNADVRVIKVPFYSESGNVRVEGPEENIPNIVNIQSGHYALTAAQQADFDDETLSVRLYFTKVEIPLSKSQILVQDNDLNPPKLLLE